jgi:hypothetical protein
VSPPYVKTENSQNINIQKKEVDYLYNKTHDKKGKLSGKSYISFGK